MYLNSIKGKKILLVGSIGILGKIFAEEIVRHGGDLIIADMNIQKLEKLAKKLSVKYFYIDLEKEKTVIDCVKKSAKYLGGIDVVISNAAITGDIIKKNCTKKSIRSFFRSIFKTMEKNYRC